MIEDKRKRGRVRIPSCCLVFLLLAAIVATGIVFFVVSGKLRVQSALDGIRAKGEPVTLSDLEPPDVPDAENAFIPYMDAARVLGSAPPDIYPATKRLREARVRDWSAADVDLLRRFAHRNDAAVRLAREASHLPGYKSDVKWKDGKWQNVGLVLHSHFADWRALTRLLSYKALVLLADGRIDEATDTCGDALAFVEHIGSEPMLVPLMVGVACRNITLGTVERIIVEAGTPAQLEHVMRMLDEHRTALSLKHVMLGERVFNVSCYEDLRRAGYDPCNLRVPWLPAWLLYHDEAAYLSIMNEYIALTDKPLLQARHELAGIDAHIGQLPIYALHAKMSCGVVPGTGSPIYSEEYTINVRPMMQADVLRAAAAIRIYKMRHGSYPAKLSALVPALLPSVPTDEYSGDKLLYEQRGSGFVVYSIGADGIDNGGVEDQTDRTKGDIIYEEK